MFTVTNPPLAIHKVIVSVNYTGLLPQENPKPTGPCDGPLIRLPLVGQKDSNMTRCHIGISAKAICTESTVLLLASFMTSTISISPLASYRV